MTHDHGSDVLEHDSDVLEHGSDVFEHSSDALEHGDHAQQHLPENYAARPHPEFVVLDIGEDVGALIVHTDRDLHGVEVEISPAEDDARRGHKDVLERTIAGRPAFTGVFDGLRQGSYTLWIDGEARARGVAITGGEIAELDWRSVRARSPAPTSVRPESPAD